MHGDQGEPAIAIGPIVETHHQKEPFGQTCPVGQGLVFQDQSRILGERLGFSRKVQKTIRVASDTLQSDNQRDR